MLFEYETNRLILKIMKPDNAQQVLNFFLEDREYFEKYEPDRVPHFYSLAHQKSLLRCEYNLAANGTVFRYYICTKDEPNRIIGTICFHNIQPSLYSSCEVGYKFLQSVQHRGIASEAMECLLTAIFHEQHLHRVYAMVEPDNQPSLCFLQRHGFEKEGCCREFAFLHGAWRDYLMYARLAPNDGFSQ